MCIIRLLRVRGIKAKGWSELFRYFDLFVPFCSIFFFLCTSVNVYYTPAVMWSKGWSEHFRHFDHFVLLFTSEEFVLYACCEVRGGLSAAGARGGGPEIVVILLKLK